VARLGTRFFGLKQADLIGNEVATGEGMTTRFSMVAALALAVFVSSVGFADAGQRHQGGGGSGTVGRAVPRGGGGSGGGGSHPGGGYPGGGGHPGGGYYYGGYYRPYGYYGYYGYPYGYYPYGYWGGYYGLGFGFGVGFGYGYGYPGYGYPYGGYVVNSYGGVKIENAPKDAAVYADGYYVGTVDDFDGSFQKLNLEPGAHHIEVMRPGGAPPASVDVNIRPGQTVTFRAN
jgi:hypothetical protein